MQATTRHGVTRKKHEKFKAYRKSVLKNPAVKRCLLILDLHLDHRSKESIDSIGRKSRV